MAEEAAIDALSALVPATLRALHAIEFAGRHLSPQTLAQVVEALASRARARRRGHSYHRNRWR